MFTDIHVVRTFCVRAIERLCMLVVFFCSLLIKQFKCYTRNKIKKTTQKILSSCFCFAVLSVSWFTIDRKIAFFISHTHCSPIFNFDNTILSAATKFLICLSYFVKLMVAYFPNECHAFIMQ